MDLTFEILEKVQHDIGGGIVFLECEDKPKLLEFYQNDKNGFMPFDERYSISDSTKYIQLFNFFNVDMKYDHRVFYVKEK